MKKIIGKPITVSSAKVFFTKKGLWLKLDLDCPYAKLKKVRVFTAGKKLISFILSNPKLIYPFETIITVDEYGYYQFT